MYIKYKNELHRVLAIVSPPNGNDRTRNAYLIADSHPSNAYSGTSPVVYTDPLIALKEGMRKSLPYTKWLSPEKFEILDDIRNKTFLDKLIKFT